MEIYSVDVLKALINQSGIKHAVLANGICDTSQLSNVLSGRRKLSAKLFSDLLLKMGHNPTDYLHINNTADIELVSKLVRLRYLFRKKSEHFWAECEAIIQELEPAAYVFSTAHAQQLWNYKAALLFRQRNYPAVREVAKQALNLTRPALFATFGGGGGGGGGSLPETIFDSLADMILTPFEAGLFIKLALGYAADATASTSKRNHLHIANDILTALWQSLNQLPDYNYEVTNVKIMTLHNYTKSLYLLGEHERAIELCDKGMELCDDYWDGKHLPMFISAKGSNLLKVGQKDAGKSYLHRACLLFEGAAQIKDLQICRDLLCELESQM